MSTTISTEQVKTIPLTLADKFKQDKSVRLVRTSSIDKIRRFNSYICTQHYYIIPALLAWLRSSQDVLHMSAEKTILGLRAMILNTIFYTVNNLDYKALSFRNISDIISNAFQSSKLYLAQIYKENKLDAKFLKFFVYLTGLILFIQLGLCIAVIFTSQIPYGLIFLLVCIGYIHILYYRAIFFFIANKMNIVTCKKISMVKCKKLKLI